MKYFSLCLLSALSFPLLVSRPALAQIDLEEDDDLEELDIAAAPTEEAQTDEAQTDEAQEAEDESTSQIQYYLGARYRLGITPKFLINAFGVDGGRTIAVNGIGGEFGASINEKWDISISPWFANYGLKETPFKGKNDADDAWELIESNLKVFYLSVDFDRRFKLTKSLDWTIGGGAGIGFVYGDLNRQEAYNTEPGAVTDPYTQLSPCDGPGVPDPVQCPVDGEYGASDKWPLYPWLTGQVGLRYQPHENFIGRFLMGIGSTGIWFGLGADYGI